MNQETQQTSGPRKQKLRIAIITAAVLLTAVVITLIFALAAGGRTPGEETGSPEQTTIAVPEETLPDRSVIPGATVNGVTYTEATTQGLDVSHHQGIINWDMVAGEDVDFVMIRVGYRAADTGEIREDPSARYNLQEAAEREIPVGVYFFSAAISEEEAVEEARWVAQLAAKYPITYPVVYNCEGFDQADSRQLALTRSRRTDIALAFLQEIAAQGYQPMFYAPKAALENEAQWQTSRLAALWPIWVAQHPEFPYPYTAQSSYMGEHAMWQFTAGDSVNGIFGKVARNVAYFGCEGIAQPQDPVPPEKVYADVLSLMEFTEDNQEVTAKELVNLRDLPSQDGDAQVLRTLKNGEVALRTGYSNSGWSRLELEGVTYYAISSYLTTDLSYTPPETEPDDGIKTEFTRVRDKVTAKEVVNLRTLPSVTHPESQVVAQLFSGEVITRTGINTDVGWSRVEYNGQTLYCVSSYLNVVE